MYSTTDFSLNSNSKMTRQLTLIVIITSVVCLVGLKNRDYLIMLYKELKSPQTLRRVEIVDEQSTLDEHSRQFPEMFLTGLTACFVSFTVGWSVNRIRKRYSKIGLADVLVQCLGEHCVLNRRMGDLEERIKELEQRDHRDDSESVSNVDFGAGECVLISDDLKLSEGEASNKAYQTEGQQDFDTTCSFESSRTNRDPSPCEETKEGTKSFKHTTTHGRSTGSICTGEIVADSSEGKVVFQKCLETYLEIDRCKLSSRDKTLYSFNESFRPFLEQTHEVSDNCKLISKLDHLQDSHKEDELDVRRIQNEKNNLVDEQVYEDVKTNANVTSISPKKDELEASINTEHGVSHLDSCIPQSQVNSKGSCWYTETENYFKENALNKSEICENMRTIDGDNIQINDSKSFSVKTNHLRGEEETMFRLDVSPSVLTVLDDASPRPDSAKSEDWRDSSSKTNLSRGRIPQYKKLHKEMKADPKTSTLNEKHKTMTTTAPHQYVDELSIDVPSTQKSCPQKQIRPSTAGDNAYTKGGQRKKKQKYYSQNSPNKTDSKYS